MFLITLAEKGGGTETVTFDKDEVTLGLLRSQIAGFQAFTKALSGSGLDANSRNRTK